MKWLPDLLLYGPILFVAAFGWIASARSLRSNRIYRAEMQHVSGSVKRDARTAGPAE